MSSFNLDCAHPDVQFAINTGIGCTVIYLPPKQLLESLLLPWVKRPSPISSRTSLVPAPAIMKPPQTPWDNYARTEYHGSQRCSLSQSHLNSLYQTFAIINKPRWTLDGSVTVSTLARMKYVPDGETDAKVEGYDWPWEVAVMVQNKWLWLARTSLFRLDKLATQAHSQRHLRDTAVLLG